MGENKEKKTMVQSGEGTAHVEQRFILLGGLIGSASTFLTTYVIQGVGFIFPLLYLLVILGLGALAGTIVFIIARRNSGSRLVSLAFAALVGFIIPICLIQTAFLVFGGD